MKNNNILYFDTSSINFINKNVKREEIKKLRKRFMDEFNGIPVISQLTLYEILCTSNENLRDDLILTCQMFFGKEIIPSLCELLDNYVKKSFPLIEFKNIKCKSNSNISKVWSDIYSDYERTIIVDTNEIKAYMRRLNEESKILYKAINNRFEEIGDDKYSMNVTVVNQLYDALLPTILKECDINLEKEILFKTNIYFIYTSFF